ncbi:EF-hand domain-containing protein [Nonomuraea africana]|uniref:Ca2+-binding EF-hand superfamily protein n=1 Tax=Nonomuraea africana TaxID=46171 RepID=A0ABR9KEI3_9ACTN|nr:EF-hand domain-containing protein [Nonomuraea africana]MBE1560436.1 Ca2+-binding EF-hand superfamily protein [Nonomuraea africana]
MLTEFYQRKMSGRFESFDHDGDGVVTQADFELMANRAVSALGLSKQAAQGKALLEGARQYWRNLAEAADSDGDGRITSEEFAGSITNSKVGTPQGQAQAAQPWVDALVQAADSDGDGRLDSQECKRMLEVLGVEPAAVEGSAPYLAEADGSIKIDTVREAALKLYTADTPYNPANASFGKF